MWNARKSVILSIVLLYTCAAVLLASCFFAPFVIQRLTRTDGSYTFGLLIFYICVGIAFIAIALLHRLLHNIRREQVFIPQNSRLLRYISWCCFVVCILTFAGGFEFYSLFLVCAAAGFMGMILRVVKNILSTATALKTENELTI